MGKTTTATVAAKEAEANHETENVTVTNSGDPTPAEGAQAAAVEAVESGDEPANIPPATSIDPSGAPQQLSPDLDLSHPAVDADPRKGTTVNQNRIDFNDPTISGREAVERSLGVTSPKGE